MPRLALWLVILPIVFLPEPAGAKPELRSSADRVASEFGTKLVWQTERITITGDDGEDLRCDPPFDDELSTFVPQLIEEIRRYTPRTFRALRIQRITLCRDLAIKFSETRTRRRSQNTFDQRREQGVPAFASYRKAAIFIDIARMIRSRGSYSRGMLHHEAFHFLDLRHPRRRSIDQKWSALNPSGFAYGSGGIDMQDGGSGLSLSIKGFASRYGTSAMAEDKAVLYEYLLREPAQMKRLIARDPIVKKKVSLLLEMLRTFSPDLDEGFFRRVAGRLR